MFKQQKSNLKHLLIVEDEADIRLYLQKSLSRDYNVCVASSGKAAWEKLESDGSSIDLVITDVMMETEDAGLVLLKKIKEKYGAKLPVIMLTSRDSDLDLLGGYQKGADYYIPKPLNDPTLKAGIKMVLNPVKQVVNL